MLGPSGVSHIDDTADDTDSRSSDAKLGDEEIHYKAIGGTS